MGRKKGYTVHAATASEPGIAGREAIGEFHPELRRDRAGLERGVSNGMIAMDSRTIMSSSDEYASGTPRFQRRERVVRPIRWRAFCE